jgi:hypothetical protein
MGGVPLCGNDGMGDASLAMESARGTDPAIDLGPWDSGAGEVDMGGGLDVFLEREVMIVSSGRQFEVRKGVGRYSSGDPHSIG